MACSQASWKRGRIQAPAPARIWLPFPTRKTNYSRYSACNLCEHVFAPPLSDTRKFPRKTTPEALPNNAKFWGVPPQQLTMGGDSFTDAATARAAGAQLILVDWGYAQGKDLSAAGCPIAHDAAQLRSLLTRGT